jgi:hypothetical protein
LKENAVSKGSVATRQSGIGLQWFWLFGALTVAICLMLNARAIAGETGSVDEYGGVALNNSVLLDPFDPVPSIHFRDGGCDWDGCGRGCYRGECGERFRCHDDCRWHGWYCEHGCYDINRPRDGAYNVGWWRCADDCRNGDWWCDHDCHLEGWHCEHDCFIHEPGRRYGRDGREHGPLPPLGDACPDVCYGRLMHQYEEALAHHAEEARKYDEQSRWYFEHVIDDHRGFIERLFDWHRHDGPPPMPPGPPPPLPMHGPDGHGPDGYGPPGGPPHGPGGYGPPPGGGYGPDHGPGPGAAYGPGPGSYGPPGPPPGPDHGGYGPPPGPGHGGYGPPGPPPGPDHGGYGPPPGPGGPGNYGGPPPGGPPPGATPPPPPGAVPTTPPPAGPGPGDFGPPGPTPH